MLHKILPELFELENLVSSLQNRARIETPAKVTVKNLTFPIYTICLGSTDPEAPVFGVFGGVHGLERIGAKVVLSYLKTVLQLLAWDETLHHLLDRTRLVFMPFINPGGTFLRQRSNPNGVDIMRNAPVDAESNPSLMVGGQRISNKLPWYRGIEGGPMEIETQALVDFVRREMFSSKVAIALDVHSGFGTKDRLWFPYAKSKRPFPHLAETFALKNLLDRTYPNHIYIVEPQAHQYTTHGDVWDYLYEEFHSKAKGQQLFIPFTLEMGSWIWVKKNPRQIFNVLGAFNPLIPHRYQRTLRRHLLLFEFLHRAVSSANAWGIISETAKEKLFQRALEHWYAI